MQAEAVFNLYHQNINRILVDDPAIDTQSILGGFKKTSVAIHLDLVALIDAQPMKQSQVVVESLRFYFSDAKIKLAEYQRSISEYERKQIDSERNLAVLQAQAQSQTSTLDFLKAEFERLHTLLDEQQKEEKILQLEEAANQKEAEFEENQRKRVNGNLGKNKNYVFS